ncbi:MAG: T9SS type A sorting domain-containing protein, partial [Fibrobacteres bacterium]|nr:T9SS type A sorting domain-containing protein [Fibrobacterota bacterium]
QMLNTRCNRAGGDLLGTFVMVSTPYFQNMERCHYKVDVPDGVYIIRTAIGDATYPNEPIWVRVGADTVARHYGQGNLNNGYSVWDDTVYVSGGTGLRFNVGDSRGLNDRVGKISYIIILSGEGVSMNDIADDQAVRAELDFSNGDCRTAETAFKVSPNPFNPSVKISINPYLKNSLDVRVYGLNGREIANLTSRVIGDKVVWDATGYASGIYTVVLKSNGKKFSRRIMLSK